MSGLNDKTLEFAERLQLAQVEEKIAQARRRQCDEPRFASWDGETCFDCGEEVLAKRLEMGRVRCVDCQTTAERKGLG
jgi:RNA polymerase-binding transcription factor DksA